MSRIFQSLRCTIGVCEDTKDFHHPQQGKDAKVFYLTDKLKLSFLLKDFQGQTVDPSLNVLVEKNSRCNVEQKKVKLWIFEVISEDEANSKSLYAIEKEFRTVMKHKNTSWLFKTSKRIFNIRWIVQAWQHFVASVITKLMDSDFTR